MEATKDCRRAEEGVASWFFRIEANANSKASYSTFRASLYPLYSSDASSWPSAASTLEASGTPCLASTRTSIATIYQATSSPLAIQPNKSDRYEFDELKLLDMWNLCFVFNAIGMHEWHEG
jgi:hypothetical protein